MELNKNGYTIIEGLLIALGLILIFVLVPVLGLWTDRNIDFWISHFKGTPVNVPYWLSLIVTVIGNAVILAVNVIGEICRFLI